mmetsp:Transcript_3858/g.15941  ORF Transcript_3858/g.15941 Transcript_3858/m.15941 type:complete len:350 (-) Transcript_3858:9233-10282(-)
MMTPAPGAKAFSWSTMAGAPSSVTATSAASADDARTTPSLSTSAEPRAIATPGTDSCGSELATRSAISRDSDAATMAASARLAALTRMPMVLPEANAESATMRSGADGNVAGPAEWAATTALAAAPPAVASACCDAGAGASAMDGSAAARTPAPPEDMAASYDGGGAARAVASAPAWGWEEARSALLAMICAASDSILVSRPAMSGGRPSVAIPPMPPPRRLRPATEPATTDPGLPPPILRPRPNPLVAGTAWAAGWPPAAPASGRRGTMACCSSPPGRAAWPAAAAPWPLCTAPRRRDQLFPEKLAAPTSVRFCALSACSALAARSAAARASSSCLALAAARRRAVRA